MLKVGIIGSGFGVYGLLPAFGLTKNCQVTCICAKKTERLLKYCKKFKVEKIYSNWRELVEKGEVDALAIAVVPDVQYKIARAAIKKGIHIFAEKPLAATYSQGLELETLAKKHKVTTAIDFIFPEIPEWIKVKELLRTQTIGKLLYLKADWNFLSYDIEHKLKSWKTDVKKGGGALSFYFSHVLYYLEDFVGEIKQFKSSLSGFKLSPNGGEVSVDLLFKSAKGISGNVHLNSIARGYKNHSLVFVCEKGTIILENNKNVTKDFTIKLLKNNKSINLKVNKKFYAGLDERVSVIKNLTNRFVKGCLNSRQIKPSFKEGLRVQKLIAQIKPAN